MKNLKHPYIFLATYLTPCIEILLFFQIEKRQTQQNPSPPKNQIFARKFQKNSNNAKYCNEIKKKHASTHPLRKGYQPRPQMATNTLKNFFGVRGQSKWLLAKKKNLLVCIRQLINTTNNSRHSIRSNVVKISLISRIYYTRTKFRKIPKYSTRFNLVYISQISQIYTRKKFRKIPNQSTRFNLV